MQIPSHLPAEVFIKGTDVKRVTFFYRVNERDVNYIKMYRSNRLYDVKDWNKKNPDYKLVQKKD